MRKWATKDGLLPGQNPAATHRNQAYVPKHISVSPQDHSSKSTIQFGEILIWDEARKDSVQIPICAQLSAEVQ